jgi:hypothetical protein
MLTVLVELWQVMNISYYFEHVCVRTLIENGMTGAEHDRKLY